MSLPWFRPSRAITRAVPLAGNTRPHCEGIRCEGTLWLTNASYPRFPLSQFRRADTSWNESVSSVTTRHTGGTLFQASTDMHPGRNSSNFSPIVDLFLLTSSPSNTHRCPVPHANILATWVLARTLCFRPVAWQGLRHGKACGMARPAAWQGLRHGKACGMARPAAWQGLRHGKACGMLCRSGPLSSWLWNLARATFPVAAAAAAVTRCVSIAPSAHFTHYM